MPREQTLYEELGVVKTATAAEIRRAYLKLAVKLHPDKNQDDTEGAKQQFQKLVRAYGILSDTEK
jgi:DnaJ homolog subfamily C member 9